MAIKLLFHNKVPGKASMFEVYLPSIEKGVTWLPTKRVDFACGGRIMQVAGGGNSGKISPISALKHRMQDYHGPAFLLTDQVMLSAGSLSFWGTP